ncbi:Maestro heat-like repeat-containing protein family member 2A, partial [Eschrichtius robustus]|nr:Maestro heat-like repeat-containing protein family member 2A [Eschrichtius robustus]
MSPLSSPLSRPQTLYVNALCALEQLMEGLVQRQLDPKGLQEMVHIPLQLGQFGALVGLISPCTCDSHRRTRLASMDVLSSLLDLHASQTCSSWGASKELELEKCKGDLQVSDMEKVFSASSRIAKVACLQFSCDEVVLLVQKLCENIRAMNLQHDKASVTWIGIFLQMRVKELEDKVAEILGTILVHLPVVDHPEVRRLLIEGILLLAHYHQETVLTSLLRQPLPMERPCPLSLASPLTEVWLTVAENLPLARAMLHALMGRLQSRFTPRADATSKADIWRLAAVDPLLTLCTIHLLTEKTDQDAELLDLFPDLVYTLLLQLSSSQGPEAMSPVLKTWSLVHTGTLPEEINLQRITIKSVQLLFRKLNSRCFAPWKSRACGHSWRAAPHSCRERACWPEQLCPAGAEKSPLRCCPCRLCVQNAEGYRQRLPELVLRGMASEALSYRISSMAVCVEQEKLLKPAALMREKGVDREDEALRVLSLRALGNMALGTLKKVCGARCPREGLRGRCRCVPGNPARADGSRAPQVRQYRKLLLEKCLCSLRGPVSPSVTADGLEALAKVLAELREGDVGSDFRAISERCRAFFDHESELLRLKAFVLFGKLAKVVRISKKHFFKEGVKKAWVPLMLHCQDPCFDAAQACVATMFRCVHFWGWKALESSSDQSDAIAPKDMTRFQITLCSVLTQKKPAVLYSFLLETMTYVKSNLLRIRIAACNLAGIIMKQVSAHYLKKLDFPTLRNSLQELQLDSDPGVRRASLETLKILDTCSHHWLLASP